VSPASRQIVVAVTGASGIVYGVRILEVLRDVDDVTTHLIMTAAGRETLLHETGYKTEEVRRLADHVYREHDVAAPLASGSFRTEGMVIVPCSIKTLSAVANSFGDNLVSRAADVTLKERRKLVLVVRETPLHLGHLRLMTAATEAGAVVLPPVPAFYHLPRTIEELVDHTVGKILDQFGIDVGLLPTWGGGRGGERADPAP
jgi:4-hydroxy-3-polyprenylbenzoate decarboxylase